ncbi:Sensor histidine kinase TmoS [compost metagenome]
MIVIEDNGSGIPQAQRSRAFTRFFRGDQATAPGGGVGGAGLGLAIVHEIITLHHGTIVIDDVPETPGIGMRFVICLPATPMTV